MRISGKQVVVTSLVLVGTWLANVRAQTVPAPKSVPPPPAPPPIKLLLTSLKPDAALSAGVDTRIAVTTDAAWLTDRVAGNLIRIDPKTNTAGKPVSAGAAGSGPCQPVLSAFKSLWVALCGSKTLVRFDSAAEKPPVPVAVDVRTVGPVVTGADSIWMLVDAATLTRIDPDTNAVVAEIALPAPASAMTFGAGALWITSSASNTVTRVNGDTNVVVETIKVGRGPVSVALGEGSAWTFNGGDGTVSRIDSKTNKVTETITSGVTGASGTIAVGEGSVWLSAPGIPLTRIDPATNTMAQQFSGPGGGALAIGLKSLWFGATPTAIWRVDPKRVEATRK